MMSSIAGGGGSRADDCKDAALLAGDEATGISCVVAAVSLVEIGLLDSDSR